MFLSRPAGFGIRQLPPCRPPGNSAGSQGSLSVSFVPPAIEPVPGQMPGRSVHWAGGAHFVFNGMNTGRHGRLIIAFQNRQVVRCLFGSGGCAHFQDLFKKSLCIKYFDGQRWTDSVFYYALITRPGFSQPAFIYLCEEKALKELLAPPVHLRSNTNYVLFSGHLNTGLSLTPLKKNRGADHQ